MPRSLESLATETWSSSADSAGLSAWTKCQVEKAASGVLGNSVSVAVTAGIVGSGVASVAAGRSGIDGAAASAAKEQFATSNMSKLKRMLNNFKFMRKF